MFFLAISTPITDVILFSNNIHQFILWRFFQGSGMSIIAIGYALIHEYFNDKNAIKLAALMANVSLLAPLLGPLIGSIIVSLFSWQYIFILTAMLGVITLIGLYSTIPKDNLPRKKIEFRQLTAQYGAIIKNKEFFQGMLCSVFSISTLLMWIGQAPNLVLYHLHQDYTHYVIYQLIGIGGLSVSSILMQFIVGKF